MPTRTDLLRGIAAGLAIAASAYAEEADRFAGTWKAEHKGTLYLVLTVTAGSPAKITLTTAEIHVGDSGDLDEIRGEVEHEERVIDSKIEDGRLVFRTEAGDGTVIRYALRVESDGAALLRLLDEPDWVKPFRLKRT